MLSLWIWLTYGKVLLSSSSLYEKWCPRSLEESSTQRINYFATCCIYTGWCAGLWEHRPFCTHKKGKAGAQPMKTVSSDLVINYMLISGDRVGMITCLFTFILRLFLSYLHLEVLPGSRNWLPEHSLRKNWERVSIK